MMLINQILQTCLFHKKWKIIHSDKPKKNLTNLTKDACQVSVITAKR